MNNKILILLILFTCPLHIQSMTTPIVITTPGLLPVAGPLDFALTSSGQACIVIASNDVQIQMNGFSIRQVPGFEQPDTIGILIMPGMQNVTINGPGTITHMNNYGIQIMDNSSAIFLNNLLINDVQNAGVFADSNRTGTGISNLFLNNVLFFLAPLPSPFVYLL